MDEREFWPRLEYRVTAEFGGFEDRRLRQYWCDGFVPQDYDLEGPEPSIRGRAWCGPDGQQPWRFTLRCGTAATTRDGIDWAALLPHDAATCWLSPDPEHATLTIDPGSAVWEDPA